MELQIVTAEQAEGWFERVLSELGITHEELDQQARDGRFMNDQARLLWMASPNGTSKR